jgi:predicted PurR-regulated permease PerM
MLKTDTGYTRNIHWVFVALFVVVLTLAVWQIRQILLLTLAAVMLTVFASMPVRYLVRRGMGRGLAILVSDTLFAANSRPSRVDPESCH